MIKKILQTSFALSIFLMMSLVMGAQPHCEVVQGNLYCPHVNDNNINAVRIEIETYLENYQPQLSIADVMIAITNLTNSLNLGTVDDHNCHPGMLEFTDRVVHVDEEGEIHEMRFRWKDSELPDGSTEYYGTYLDLHDLYETRADSSDISGLTLNVPETTMQKCFAFNARCTATTQSSYYIIIIDRDISLKGLSEVRTDQSGEGEPQAIEQPELKVAPNPLADTQANIAFYIPEEQNISIELFDGGSGKRIRAITSNEKTAKGTHYKTINMDDLAPGVYYLSLRTEATRIVEKIVKVKL